MIRGRESLLYQLEDLFCGPPKQGRLSVSIAPNLIGAGLYTGVSQNSVAQSDNEGERVHCVYYQVSLVAGGQRPYRQVPQTAPENQRVWETAVVNNRSNRWWSNGDSFLLKSQETYLIKSVLIWL